MQIANSVLIEFIEAFRTTPNSAADQRSAARTALHVKVQVTLIEAGTDEIAGTTYSAVTRDLSTSGVGLFQNRPLPRNQHLLITLSRPTGTPISIRCTVMHCQELADGIYGVGASIDNVFGQGQTSAPTGGKGSRRPPVTPARE